MASKAKGKGQLLLQSSAHADSIAAIWDNDAVDSLPYVDGALPDGWKDVANQLVAEEVRPWVRFHPLSVLSVACAAPSARGGRVPGTCVHGGDTRAKIDTTPSCLAKMNPKLFLPSRLMPPQMRRMPTSLADYVQKLAPTPPLAFKVRRRAGCPFLERSNGNTASRQHSRPRDARASRARAAGPPPPLAALLAPGTLPFPHGLTALIRLNSLALPPARRTERPAAAQAVRGPQARAEGPAAGLLLLPPRPAAGGAAERPGGVAEGDRQRKGAARAPGLHSSFPPSHAAALSLSLVSPRAGSEGSGAARRGVRRGNPLPAARWRRA